MAVTGTYLDVLTHLLKTRYIDRVNWAMKRKHVWLAHVKRQKRALSGTTFTHPVMTAETQGVGPGAHTSDLPTPGYTAGINPTWSPRPHRRLTPLVTRPPTSTAWRRRGSGRPFCSPSVASGRSSKPNWR